MQLFFPIFNACLSNVRSLGSDATCKCLLLTETLLPYYISMAAVYTITSLPHMTFGHELIIQAIGFEQISKYSSSSHFWQCDTQLKALSHGAIFLATCNAILLLGDVKLANTCFHHSLLIYS